VSVGVEVLVKTWISCPGLLLLHTVSVLLRRRLRRRQLLLRLLLLLLR
jgi:hypothetical protein